MKSALIDANLTKSMNETFFIKIDLDPLFLCFALKIRDVDVMI